MLSLIARISPRIPPITASRPHNSQVCAIGLPSFLSSLSRSRFPLSVRAGPPCCVTYPNRIPTQSPIACRVALDRRGCGSVRLGGSWRRLLLPFTVPYMPLFALLCPLAWSHLCLQIHSCSLDRKVVITVVCLGAMSISIDYAAAAWM